MNTVVAADQFTAANGYSVTESGHGLPQPVGELLRPRPCRHAGVQGRPQGGGAAAGYGPDPLPSVPPVRRRSSRTTRRRTATTHRFRAAPRTARRPRRPAGPPRTRRRACGRSRSKRVAPLTRVAAPFSLTMSILGRDRVSEPGHDRVGHPRRSGCPVATPLTNQFGAFTGRTVGSTLGSATISTRHDREHRSEAVHRRGHAGNDVASRDDRRARPTRPPTSTCSSSTARPAAALIGPVGRRRLRGVGHHRQPGGGHLHGPRRRLRGSGGHDDLQVRRRVHQRGLRLGVGHGRQRPRPAGTSWTVPGAVTANSAPAAGRVLLGAVQVRTDTNVLVGSADVIVQAVTP